MVSSVRVAPLYHPTAATLYYGLLLLSFHACALHHIQYYPPHAPPRFRMPGHASLVGGAPASTYQAYTACGWVGGQQQYTVEARDAASCMLLRVVHIRGIEHVNVPPGC